MKKYLTEKRKKGGNGQMSYTGRCENCGSYTYDGYCVNCDEEHFIQEQTDIDEQRKTYEDYEDIE